eukprot:12939130-Prorocentrum_lima.AAC.1
MTVLKRANELSQAFLAALQSGKMCEAFSTAGDRFRMTPMVYDDVEGKYETYTSNPSKENLDILETAEELLSDHKAYRTC